MSSIVSISEASRLTGKTRATIHRHINTGKLSKSINDTGGYGVDITELIRVYGSIKDTDSKQANDVKIEQRNTDETNALKARLAVLEAENNVLKDHVSSLKQALHLIEYKAIELESTKEQQETTKTRKKFLGLF